MKERGERKKKESEAKEEKHKQSVEKKKEEAAVKKKVPKTIENQLSLSLAHARARLRCFGCNHVLDATYYTRMSRQQWVQRVSPPLVFLLLSSRLVSSPCLFLSLSRFNISPSKARRWRMSVSLDRHSGSPAFFACVGVKTFRYPSVVLTITS